MKNAAKASDYNKPKNEINELADFLSYFEEVNELNNGEYEALCPAHDDNNPSLHINNDGKRIVMNCKAGCDNNDILNKIGLNMDDLFLSDKRRPIITNKYNDQTPKNVKSRANLTVKELAKKKGFSPEYLDKYCTDRVNSGVKIHYKTKSGKLAARHRLRFRDNKTWTKSDHANILCYGIWKIDDYEEDYLILVEGESDCWTLWKHGIQAIGVPGNTLHKKLKKTYVDKFEEIVIWQEHGESGQTFVDNLYKRLENINYDGEINVLYDEQFDDPNDIYQFTKENNNKNFKKYMENKYKNSYAAEEVISSDLQANDGDENKNDQDLTEEFYPTALARNFIDEGKMEGKRWVYVAEEDIFYQYKDAKGFWRQIDDSYLESDLRSFLIDKNVKWDRDNKRNEVLKALKDLIIDIEAKDKFDAGINPDTKHINVKNGMLDWKNDELKEHEPEYYSQFQLPIKYDSKAECPKWEAALKDWVPEEDARKFLQEYVGYCLIPSTKFQIALILHGSGSNGKSTFLEVINDLFGDSNLSNIPMHRITERFETANLQDKLVNICSDIDPTYLKKTGDLKAAIAGERLRGEYKYGKSFDFRPVVRLIFSANEIPKARDKTEAWYRRLKIINFPNTFSKEDENYDPDIKEKLRKELPGILNWSLEGLRRLQENDAFTDSKAMNEAKEKYERENDSIMAFLSNCTSDDPDSSESIKRLYAAYKNFCDNNGFKPQTKRTLTDRLRKENYQTTQSRVNGKNCKCFNAIKLK